MFEYINMLSFELLMEFDVSKINRVVIWTRWLKKGFAEFIQKKTAC